MREYKGLNDMQVELSRKQNGNNWIETKKQETLFTKYISNFKDPLIIILIVALAINLFFVFLGRAEWYETVGIFVSILISTFVSTISEYKNENVFKKMQDESSNIKCKIYRNGILQEISLSEIVVGDICLLQPGDAVPADGIIIDGEIKIDQSSLNGENTEIKKYASLKIVDDAEWTIDLFNSRDLARGSFVCFGSAIMKILKVGKNTIYGKIASEIEENERESPLTLKLSKLANGISKFGYIGASIIVILHMLNSIFIKNHFDSFCITRYLQNTSMLFSDFVDAMILGIIVVVVAVPEGLPLMIAIVCSINMKKMLKDNVLVRKIIGIETAGSLNILFSDKTGTITEGKLKVTKVLLGNQKWYEKYEELSETTKDLFYACLEIASSAKRSGNKIIGGNSTEKSLLKFIKESRNIRIEKTKELAFNSEKKFSSSRLNGDFDFTVIKGAPEKIIKKCKFYFDENGRKISLNNQYELNKIIDEMSSESYRAIAIAANSEEKNEEIGENMTLVALLFLRDEIRSEAAQAIEEVKRAGISVVMITGDKKETAVAIAKECGLIKTKKDIVLTSQELNSMTDEEIKNEIPNIRVIARALPTDKSRMVKICQEMGLVVGMTGDGVNDSAALKISDVSFAMGSGSEISKEASDIVILDNNFSSIKKAILYGRTIYNNIKKFITFQLTINVAAITISILGPIIGIGKALDITQMLWVNLVMDTLAAIAFGEEAAIRKYMNEKPKNREENIIDKNMWSAIITNGLFISLLSMIMFITPTIKSMFRPSYANLYFYTGYFTFFIFACIFNAFNTRTDSMYLLENISINKKFIMTMTIIAIIQVFMTHFGGAILRTSGLTFKEWMIVLSLASLIVPVDIMRKFFLRTKMR